MISLKLTLGGNGPVALSFNSGLISNLHLTPPADGSALGLQVNQLQPAFLSVSAINGQLNPLVLDLTEGPDPLWLSYTIDCTGGGSVTVAFPGSPTLMVNPGSWLTMEYNNGNPPPAPPPAFEGQG